MDPTEARAEWHRFCEAIERAGDAMLRPETPTDDLTQAEGYRHLVRMVRAGFEATCEFADPHHPEIVPMIGPTLLYEGVTPDARYHHAFIDGSLSYRVRGRRGTAPLIEISVYTGQTGLHPTNDLVGSITEAELEVETDGTFTLHLGPEERPGNWIRTDAETRRLFIRQYAHDWTTCESATYEIECVSETRPPTRLTLDRVATALEHTATFVAAGPAFWAGISDYWKGHAVNEIVSQAEADARTDITVPSGHRFACGYYQLAPDQALEITFAPSDVPYWGLGLNNYWKEPFHWPATASAINNVTAVREPDGSVRATVAHRAPGNAAGNWLDTNGHAEGTIVFRWSRTKDPLPVFTTRIVKNGSD